MHQAELELRYAEPHQDELVYGTVRRHRLYSDANGRWLEFSLVEGDSRILCRWGVEGQVQRQFIHGKRYAVMGVVTRDDLQPILVVVHGLAVGHLETDRHTCNSRGRARRRGHRALHRRFKDAVLRAYRRGQ